MDPGHSSIILTAGDDKIGRIADPGQARPVFPYQWNKSQCVGKSLSIYL
jgi:hypothetical protein